MCPKTVVEITYPAYVAEYIGLHWCHTYNNATFKILHVMFSFEEWNASAFLDSGKIKISLEIRQFSETLSDFLVKKDPNR